jgi:di/tricarboxylate transporter
MSDSTTTALFAPIALALASALGRPPEPFVVTVAMASVVAFLAPNGHHGNLLVYGPGRYQFMDFVKVGAPLTVICGWLWCWWPHLSGKDNSNIRKTTHVACMYQVRSTCYLTN